jgi:pSer/pThr/pTyr-binding forkhead associated (FHA) protein
MKDQSKELAMNIKFKVLRGGHVGKEYAVPTPCCLIGRRPYCHLQLNSEAISRGHCLVQDLKSHNGTFVNGKRILKECEVQDGERLQIGPMVLEIRIERASADKQSHVMASDRRASERFAGDVQTAHDSKDVAPEIAAVDYWLEDADERERLRRLKAPATRPMRRDDTNKVQRRQAKATENRNEQKKQPEAACCATGKEASCLHAHVVGKLPPRPQEVYKDSSEAAAKALKSFFERRR